MADPGDRERPDPDDGGLSGMGEAYRKASPYMAASTSLVVAVGGLAWLGHWADGKLSNETPWLTLLGALLGMVGGFIGFFRTVLGKTK
jgi:hypothetical protein